jgi:hypothetical protein
MAVPIGAALAAAKPLAPKVLGVVGPIAGREALKVATAVTGNKKCKRRAHDMAYDRNGRYGQVTFSDGIRRWVVAGSDGEVCASFPPLEDSSPGHLREQLVGVDLAKCLRVPEKQVKEAQKSSKTA